MRAIAGLLVLGCLLLAAPFDLGALTRIAVSDHPHAIRTVVDGIHVDLILAHDASQTSPHPGESDPHLHARLGEDHVVHLSRGELGPAQRNAVFGLDVPTSLPIVPDLCRAADRIVRLAARPRIAPVSAFSRRSVVLRT